MTNRLLFSHPNRKRLQAWLDDAPLASDEAASLDAHIAQCDRCATRIESLVGGVDLELAPDDELAEAIRDAFTPPDDLNDRVMRTIDERERADREISLLLGMFSIAKDAAELMMPPVDGPADHES